MAESTLYERLVAIFAIAAVVDSFSDRLLKSRTIVQANSELHQWHTVTDPGRLAGLKWLRTLWLASLAGDDSSTPAKSGDIVRTVAAWPSLTGVAILAAIVLIRTFLSFSLQVETTGRWPWQKRGTSAS